MNRKSFKDITNPAEMFLSKETIEAVEPQIESVAPAAAPEGYKVNPIYIETKSRRVQLLMQPSLVDRIKAEAKAQGLSMNELIHSTLEDRFKE